MLLWALIVVNTLLTGAAVALVQRRSPNHLHLLSLLLVSLWVAYPFKCALLLLDPDGFMTFTHEVDVFNYGFVNIYYFVNMLACMAAVLLFLPREQRDFTERSRALHPTFWLLLISVVLIVAYRDIYVEYYLDFSLVKNELRRKSLEAQVGYGWITVLMLWGLPLVYFTLRSNASWLLRAAAVGAFLSVLLVVGSRAYLLGAVLLACVAAIGFSAVRACIVLGLLGIAASVIGMLSWADDNEFLFLFALRRFMQTYDGFDLFAAYVQNQQGQPLLWGQTIFEDIFITYIPRFMWEGKPFLFGSNALVASMFPDLSDTEGLMATFPSGFLLEQFANFSLFGVLFAFLLFALFSRFPRPIGFKSRFVYLGLFAFSPTFFRSAASFITLMLVLLLLAVIVDVLERLLDYALGLLRRYLANTRHAGLVAR
ncbi:hypothetical protein [Steroidobacter sp.]|uniref:hypothetical protein n=1 Tax=Steroidobacter sp. TaxID=1978227 RepID=UPI001A5F810D|nr:hypothetical protein [Steroidobacter sp.]MBL8267296.1 hypothetical protein [Steroidobacter sp.]